MDEDTVLDMLGDARAACRSFLSKEVHCRITVGSEENDLVDYYRGLKQRLAEQGAWS